MSAVADQEILDRKAELLDRELDKFLNCINTSKRPIKTECKSFLLNLPTNLPSMKHS